MQDLTSFNKLSRFARLHPLNYVNKIVLEVNYRGRSLEVNQSVIDARATL